MLILWMVAAAFAGKWDDKVSDIVAERTIAAPPEVVYAALADVEQLQALFPADCASWGGPFAGDGVGATAIVTYTAAGWHRRLDAEVRTIEAPRIFDLDHPGNKGFVTRWQLEPQGADGAATRVSMKTLLNPPPPLTRGYFYKKVQPAWTGCHERVLSNLETRVLATPSSTGTPE